MHLHPVLKKGQFLLRSRLGNHLKRILIYKELFELAEPSLGYFNFSKGEWQAMRALENDRRIVIKKADKGSCVVVCNRNDYITEREKNS